MKDRKKPKGTKVRVKGYEKSARARRTAIMVTILIAIIAISSFLVYFHVKSSQNQIINSDQTNSPTFQFKAAIIDQLSLTLPNETFNQTARNILENAGYTVDYFQCEEVTVEFFRDLPVYGYRLIILRVHSGLLLNENPPVALFTSESYSKSKYFSEQWTNQLACVSIQLNSPMYFGIRPEFVRLSMNGRFQDSTVIMMGCNGLTYTDMAKAFTEKGAKAYIAWTGKVSASQTDRVTTRLLKHLLMEKQTIEQAIAEAMKEADQDSPYESTLTYYPLEAGEHRMHFP